MKNTNIRDKARPYVYISPLMISIFLLSLVPILYTVYIGFTNYNINHLNDYHLVGFANYKTILAGPLKSVFLPVFLWTCVFAAASALGTYLIGLIFALVLSDTNMKERNFYKALLIIPWAIPGTISLLAWSGLLNEDFGGINLLLKNLHLINNNIPWMTSAFWCRVGVIVVNFWAGFPWMMNICLGALSAIDDTYYEAADIDGATPWQKFIKITLPSITASSLPLLISSFAFNFNNFGAIYFINQGGPPRLDTQYAGYTDILVSACYRMSVSFFRYDYGGALSVLIFIVIGSVSFIQMKKTNAFREAD